MPSTSSPAALGDAYTEITNWFFEDYLQPWMTAVETSSDPSFIADFWGAPLWIGLEDGPAAVFNSPEEITGWFKDSFDRLQSADYTHTAVLDRRVMIFHRHGGAIDVIWSRRRGDDSEIERLAVHFIIARRTDGLRIVSIEGTNTDADTLDEVWPIHRGDGQ
ncbi:hypothetical protein [Streptantibioticus ferralitis]|uniref:DUF6841 domain-containing protein n=1 Tax=Streptantibioticus ferralitis TaxID=236510 RepID=A0ABT5Z574_9ACTN|nr:hypothetical protein [Streptantibioticus ferralitis]MDF2258864.1 hypothetical protein [Streptantibioticus ferralitis]